MKRIAALSSAILMSASMAFADQSSPRLQPSGTQIAVHEPVVFAVGSPAKGGEDVQITIIGCIRRNESVATTLGATVIPEGQTRYMLSDITLAADSGDAGSAAAVLSETVNAYRLDDAAAAIIAPHVGDRVQVTGTVVMKPPSPVGTSGITRGSSDGAARPPMLRVDSLRRLSSSSPSCSQ